MKFWSGQKNHYKNWFLNVKLEFSFFIFFNFRADPCTHAHTVRKGMHARLDILSAHASTDLYEY